MAGIVILDARVTDPYGATGAVFPGERGEVRFRLENATGAAIRTVTVSCTAALNLSNVRGTYRVMPPMTVGVTVAKGASAALSLPFTAADAGDGEGLYAALRAAGVRSWSWCDLTVEANGFRGAARVTECLFPDRRCAPSVERFSVARCGPDGVPDDEGACALLTARLSLEDRTWADRFKLTLGYSSAADAGEIDLTDDVAGALGGAGEASISRVVEREGGFDTGRDWTFRLTLADGGAESADAYGAVHEAFANVHLSGCATGGVAFGRFGTSAENEPKFECAYPAYLEGGIEALSVNWRETDGPAVSATVDTPGSSGFGNGRLGVGRVGDHVYIRGGVEARAGDVIGMLPEDCVPMFGNVYSLRPCSGGRIARVYAGAEDGLLHLEWVRALSDGSAYTAKLWVDCNMDYWV